MKITFTEEELTNIRALYNIKESNKSFQVKTNDEMAERIIPFLLHPIQDNPKKLTAPQNLKSVC
jgi:hypothetical protein